MILGHGWHTMSTFLGLSTIPLNMLLSSLGLSNCGYHCNTGNSVWMATIERGRQSLWNGGIIMISKAIGWLRYDRQWMAFTTRTVRDDAVLTMNGGVVFVYTMGIIGYRQRQFSHGSTAIIIFWV